MMLDEDASPLVRQAMAEVFARSTDAPAAIVQALAVDQPSVALPILEHSPLLIDADLVDIVATCNCDMQCAIARRVNLPVSVSAAIAEVGTPAAALEADSRMPMPSSRHFHGIASSSDMAISPRSGNRC